MESIRGGLNIFGKHGEGWTFERDLFLGIESKEFDDAFEGLPKTQPPKSPLISHKQLLFRKLGAFCLALSLCAFVTAFIKTSGCEYSNQCLIPPFSAISFHKINSINDYNNLSTLTSPYELEQQKRNAAESVDAFLTTDTRKFVTLTFNACGGLANMVRKTNC
jgi:hypothetical protein